MNTEQNLEAFNIACEELKKDMYGRDPHCDWLSGGIFRLQRLVENMRGVLNEEVFNGLILGYAQQELLLIAKEFEDWKDGKGRTATYYTFGG